MKPDYKNRMPKGMIYGFLGGAAAMLVITLVIGCGALVPEGEGTGKEST